MGFLLLTLIAVAFSAKYGVDLAESISVSSIQCLRNLGFNSFFIFRAWRSLGSWDPNAYQINMNAVSAGFDPKVIDAYFYPCVSCGDAAGQVSSFWSNVVSKGMKFERVWFDIEGTWTGSYSSNKNFFLALISQQQAIGFKAGIYSSYYQWEDIFSLSYNWNEASSYPLWYAHYDSSASFSDFKAFGGWSSPYMKQYNGDMTACSHDVDYNYRA
ncbi:lysozyme, putative [Entamoeba invadens IP1]|uniref:lysozyme n=1 Tax=Entamoeba invadens IP1 TaxID=370355 RepID=A0A0A1U2P9_ENTIV|nr:lysozyme, putative [Entamoeba invadens IP1]ELP88332.1 lysozyme, putative [Entamoeba invadens IP1]|eukprot:XP_004255103.1 lysozyme, putative [Entamoeba invadens IP1]